MSVLMILLCALMAVWIVATIAVWVWCVMIIRRTDQGIHDGMTDWRSGRRW